MSDLPNPVIPEDSEAAELLSAAHQEDHKPFSDEVEESPVEASEDGEPNEAELLKAAVVEDRPRDALGRFTKTETGEDIPEDERKSVEEPVSEAAEAPVAAPESEYAAKQRERKEKETARLDKTWENVNREKEELAARREELRRYEESLKTPPKQAPQPREFSSQQLVDAAQDFKTQEQTARVAARKALEIGDYDEFGKLNEDADKAGALAEQAFNNATEFYQLEQQEQQQLSIQKHNQVWVQNMEAEIKAMPDLGKPETPIAKEMLELLKTHGAVFQMLPDGFKQASVIAKLRLDAAETPKLREKLKTVEAELAHLRGATSLGKGGPTSGPVAAKNFDSLPLEEQRERLMQMAEAADES